jgi:hypothetical protein
MVMSLVMCRGSVTPHGVHSALVSWMIPETVRVAPVDELAMAAPRAQQSVMVPTMPGDRKTNYVSRHRSSLQPAR